MTQALYLVTDGLFNDVRLFTPSGENVAKWALDAHIDIQSGEFNTVTVVFPVRTTPGTDAQVLARLQQQIEDDADRHMRELRNQWKFRNMATKGYRK